jgi:hypothetical protein
MIWQVILAFLGMVALDYVWARYVLTLTKKRIIVGSSYAAGIMLLNGMVTLTYVSNPWMILPAAAGAFIGTYIGGKFDGGFVANRAHALCQAARRERIIRRWFGLRVVPIDWQGDA